MSLILLNILIAIIATIFLWYKSLPRYRMGKFPSPPGHFLLGHVPYMDKSEKLLPYIHRQLLENKGFASVSIGLKRVLFVSDGEFLKWILNSPIHVRKTEEYKIFNDWIGTGLIGTQWKQHRKDLSAAFHRKMLEHLIQVSNNMTSTLMEKLGENVGKASVDVYPLISSFSLDVVSENIMAIPVDVQKNADSTYKRSIDNLCRILTDRGFDILKMYDFLFKFQKDHEVFASSVNDVHNCARAAIEKRRQNLNEREDDQKLYLDILLSRKDENNDYISDKQMVEEISTLIFTGYETISASTSFALYNLAKYPEIQTRALEEQRLLFGAEKNPMITYDDINNMKYLDMVIKESLRLYPGAPLIGRTIQEDTYYKGELLPQGLGVFLSLYTFHRTPEFFSNPEKFDPNRFEVEQNITYPFSTGYRNCIGQKYAMIAMKQVISAILRNYELITIPEHILKLKCEVTLKSSNGICIQLQTREY